MLLEWKDAWHNAGPDHGRDCRFATREDAEEWAAIENYWYQRKERRFAVIELPLPPPAQ